MTDIGKGDLVECIEPDDEDGIVAGRVYTVSETMWHPHGCCNCHGKNLGGLWLHEAPPRRPGAWFCVGAFRRLGPKRGAFDHLLTSTPAKAPEEAAA